MCAATPSEVAKEKSEDGSKLSDELTLLEEAFWLADLYVVPRTYSIGDDMWKATDCVMCNALQGSATPSKFWEFSTLLKSLKRSKDSKVLL